MHDAERLRKVASLAAIAVLFAASGALWPHSAPDGILPVVGSPRLSAAAAIAALDVPELVDRRLLRPRSHRAVAAAAGVGSRRPPAPPGLESSFLAGIVDVAPALTVAMPRDDDWRDAVPRRGPVERAFRTAGEKTGAAVGTAARIMRGIF